MNLDKDALLEREPELRILLRRSGDLQIERDGETLNIGRRSLSVLEAFSKPTTLQAAFETLIPGNAGRVEGLEIMETIFGMLNAGILRRVEGQDEVAKRRSTGLDTVPSHINLLNDRVRTSSFLAAIAEVVKPGDVVVDIGTGTGVLAVAAARAGARRVYAIEGSGIAVAASAVFAESGFGDRITLLRGWSYGISLPEPADVLVTETIGNDPLDERIVDVVMDARRRLLKDGARVIPASVRVYVQAFQIPASERESLTFGPESIRTWRESYGIDFEPARRATEGSLRRWRVSPHAAAGWQALHDPVRLLEIDLSAPHDLPSECVIELPPTERRPDGILVFFEAQLSPSVSLSTRPGLVKPDNSWTSPMWLLPATGVLPRELRFRFEARRRIRLDWPE